MGKAPFALPRRVSSAFFSNSARLERFLEQLFGKERIALAAFDQLAYAFGIERIAFAQRRVDQVAQIALGQRFERQRADRRLARQPSQRSEKRMLGLDDVAMRRDDGARVRARPSRPSADPRGRSPWRVWPRPSRGSATRRRRVRTSRPRAAARPNRNRPDPGRAPRRCAAPADRLRRARRERRARGRRAPNETGRTGAARVRDIRPERTAAPGPRRACARIRRAVASCRCRQDP